VGDTKRPLLYLSLSGVLNVVLNLIFVIVLHMSVVGVALASIIAQYLSALLVVLCLLRSHGIHELRLKKLRLYPDKAMRLLALGIPAGCQNAIFHIANLFIQASVNSFDTVMVAGNSAAANADGLVYDVMAAFYTACSSFMSQNYGAGKRERILKSYFISLAYSFAAGAILGGLLVVFGRPFLALFATDNDKTVSIIWKIQRQLEQNYAERITLASLAAEHHISPSYLSHLFKRITGYTIIQYLTMCRLSVARKLLSETDLSITEVVYATGFSDCSNFSRLFKREIGCSPVDYKKQEQSYGS
jgi:AraC-like DNA-binding protein